MSHVGVKILTNVLKDNIPLVAKEMASNYNVYMVIKATLGEDHPHVKEFEEKMSLQ
jgi:hypothetical protein